MFTICSCCMLVNVNVNMNLFILQIKLFRAENTIWRTIFGENFSRAENAHQLKSGDIINHFKFQSNKTFLDANFFGCIRLPAWESRIRNGFFFCSIFYHNNIVINLLPIVDQNFSDKDQSFSWNLLKLITKLYVL